MKRKTLFAALACALLVFSMLGCGTTNHLQSIQITRVGSGLFDLNGLGGTLQLVATGNYSDGKKRDLSNVVAWSVIVNPNGMALPNPPLTVTMSPTGLMTAVNPAVCSEEHTSQDKPQWSVTGGYIVTASIQGVTSQQVFVSVASATGDGPGGACGPDQVSQ